MKITPTAIPDVLIIDPDVYEDKRGFFMESYNEKHYRDMGIEMNFVQDNLSYSSKGVLRGLHFQDPKPQAKLAQVVHGEVFDVAVDIRKGSSSFGTWVGVTLSGSNRRQLYMPEGFAHGYCVLSDVAIFQYKCSRLYTPGNEKGIIWNDETLQINWPIQNPIISPKDLSLPSFKKLL